ncbi:MAG: ribosome maturation factor RimP [Gammaproteobacteria bacterium]|nr:ribosome maturation factor RimP [Gammaproteobacteria bacterium]MDH5653041.1 ribosome maturation factor RimP [Gammaproteobacteria bacterium]
MAGQVQKTLVNLLEPVVEGMGFELVGIEYLPQGRHSLLRVYIDKEQGILLEDCEQVSRQISGVLDVEDPITGQYVLEVSSPGMERPLFKAEHYARYIGQAVKLRLSRPLDGQRKFRGVLLESDAEHIVIQVEEPEERTVKLALVDVEKANLDPVY